MSEKAKKRESADKKARAAGGGPPLEEGLGTTSADPGSTAAADGSDAAEEAGCGAQSGGSGNGAGCAQGGGADRGAGGAQGDNADSGAGGAQGDNAGNGAGGAQGDNVGSGAGDAQDSGADGGSADGTDAAGQPDESADMKYMRLAADFQNFRKRTERERFERYSEGKKDFAADLLPVLDNFERAIGQDAAVSADSEAGQFLEGMKLIYEQLAGVLAKNGVEEIPSLGEDFDPNLHHAVQQMPSEEHGSGKVMQVLQKGYRMGDKVVRPAMVVVAQ
jgi:molecular chaperone GrpE